jgi:hypothetical protein
MDDNKITQAELRELFGEAIPIEVVDLLWNVPDEKTISQLRAELREKAVRLKAGREPPLAPCPLCEGPAKLTSEDWNRYGCQIPGGWAWFVSCESCGLTLGDASTERQTTSDEVIARWNERPVRCEFRPAMAQDRAVGPQANGSLMPMLGGLVCDCGYRATIPAGVRISAIPCPTLLGRWHGVPTF